MSDVNMTHPDILKIERWGYKYHPPKIKLVGECEQCKQNITDDYEYYESRDGLFCSDDCLQKYYDIVHIR